MYTHSHSCKVTSETHCVIQNCRPEKNEKINDVVWQVTNFIGTICLMTSSNGETYARICQETK
jgi:hypothetical protein